jgi:hypothetical protein
MFAQDFSELVLSWATLHFVGWVEPAPGFVGFRCTQPNLHVAGVIANCETQQRPLSEPSPIFVTKYFRHQNTKTRSLINRRARQDRRGHNDY